MSCPVCLDDATRPVSCPHCAVDFCGGCFERCLLNSDIVPTCPDCLKPWTDDFTDEAVKATFRNGALRDHRTKILVDQETARLPEIQERARRYLLAKKHNGSKAPEYVRTMVIRDGMPLQTAWYDVATILAGDQFYGNSDWRTDGVPAERVSLKVMRSCPKACRGFLGENGICGVCDAAICLKCHEDIEKEGTLEGSVPPHRCDPAAVATVALLVKETKPCPTCHVPISKIDGCDQMWCTQCQTPFSWRTGQKEAGIVHNPHYYQWMRANGNAIPRRDVVDPCALQQLPWEGQYSQDAQRTMMTPYIKDINADKVNRFIGLVEGIHRSIAEAQQYYRRPNDAWHLETLNKISFKYMVKATNQKEWARLVYLEKRAQRRITALHDIRTAFYNAGKDLINGYFAMAIAPVDFVRQMHALQIFIDDAVHRCCRRFFYSSKDFYVIPTSWYRVIGSAANWRIKDKEFAAISLICNRTITKDLDISDEDYCAYINYVLSE